MDKQTDPDFGGDRSRNGASLLSDWFTDIFLRRYVDELVFLDPQPIFACVLSEAQVGRRLKGERLQAFRHFVKSELASKGQIHVTNRKVHFEACRR